MDIKFPDNNNFYITYKNKPLFYEPVIEIGKHISAKIIKTSPIALNLIILSIENFIPKICYKAIYRPDNLQIEFDCDINYKVGDLIEGDVIALGDKNGILIGNIRKIQ